jgi:hypothetical protein
MRAMLVLSLIVVCWTLQHPATAGEAKWTMLVDIEGRHVEGTPLAWSRDHVFLLARDGRLWDLPPQKTNNYRKISSSFASYSATEMRAELERELRGQLEVTGTGHYLVAHPIGKGDHWAGKFEELYRSCVNYFSLRGLRVHEPDFPLVAVVWPRREEFDRRASTDGGKVSPDVLGFYSPTTNRVSLYDQQGGTGGKRSWSANEATIIHEATHQMAFNIGVHNRFGGTPRWLAEGLGTMFEAQGVWDWRNHPQLAERVNRDRLLQFRQWQKNGRPSGTFVNLLSSDRFFETNPQAAYAESWAWVLFLTETYPQKFSEYVQRTAQRPSFEAYPLARRLADFSEVFGSDQRMLEKHFLDFVAALPK